LAKEWKLPAATAGDVFFTPDVSVAKKAYHSFFSQLPCSSFEPSLPRHDLRSLHRFEKSSVGSELSELACFPFRFFPQCTVAIVFPPNLDSTLYRALTVAEQQGFSLVAALVGGRVPEDFAQPLFDQEVADKSLAASDWSAFREALGGSPAQEDEDEDEGSFKCVYLVLCRQHAIKRLAQLCGDGNPAVNQQHLHVALRAGRDKVHNGIRCATSQKSVEALLASLERGSVPRLMPRGMPSSRRLGVDADASEQAVECALAAAAVTQADTTSFSPGQLVRDLHHALTEQGLAVVALQCVPASKAAWPGSLSGRTELLASWAQSRPAAARIVDLATAGSHFVIAACEGSQASLRVRMALGVMSAAGKGSIETYAPASSSEAASDVAHLFDRLFGGRHYVVQDE